MIQNTRANLARLVLTALLASGAGAMAADLSSFPASTQNPVTYDKDIQPIFKEYCFKCHGTGPRFSGGLHLETLAGALKGGKDGPVLKVGDSANSDIVLDVARVSDSPMPPKPRRPRPSMDTNAPPPPPPPPAVVVPAEQVGLIRAWIDQGAK